MPAVNPPPRNRRSSMRGKAALRSRLREQDQERGRACHAGDHRQRNEGPHRQLVQRQHREQQRRHQEQGARPVERLGDDVRRARQDQPAQHDGRGREGHRHPEHPLPAQRGEQQPARRRSDADADRLRGGEAADGMGALVAWHRLHQDGDAVGAEQAAADALQGAEGDQRRQVLRQPAHQRGRAEQGKARRDRAACDRPSRRGGRTAAGTRQGPAGRRWRPSAPR